MDREIHIAGKIFSDKIASQDLNFEGFSFCIHGAESGGSTENAAVPENSSDKDFAVPSISLKNAAEGDLVSDEILTALCKSLSEKYECTAFLYRDTEFYGNANVFNGGSDYEVIDEECFLVAFDKGRCTLKETTHCWNPKIDSMTEGGGTPS